MLKLRWPLSHQVGPGTGPRTTPLQNPVLICFRADQWPQVLVDEDHQDVASTGAEDLQA